MFIENVAVTDVSFGWHRDPGPKAMLIGIRDPGTSYRAQPGTKFSEYYEFEFLDIDDAFLERNPDLESQAISQEQARRLVELLQRALDQQLNVIVYCTAGICRSGAVADIAVQMGFDDPKRLRRPNYRVHRLMSEEMMKLAESRQKS